MARTSKPDQIFAALMSDPLPEKAAAETRGTIVTKTQGELVEPTDVPKWESKRMSASDNAQLKSQASTSKLKGQPDESGQIVSSKKTSQFTPKLYPRVLSRRVGRPKDLSIMAFTDLLLYRNTSPKAMRDVLLKHKELNKRGKRSIVPPVSPDGGLLSCKREAAGPSSDQKRRKYFVDGQVDLSKFVRMAELPKKRGRGRPRGTSYVKQEGKQEDAMVSEDESD